MIPAPTPFLVAMENYVLPGVGTVDARIDDVGLFNLADLLVDEDNFRLEPSPDQPTALKNMLRKQKGKLVVLATSILDSGGLSRGEFIWLAPDPRPEFDGKYVVCEGNRRVTALKMMNEPGLAEGTTWAKRFRELGERFRKSPITSVRAVLYPSVEEAREDVYRRHTNDQEGAGLEAWDTFAQDRANKRSGSRRNLSMVVLEHLSDGTTETLALQLGVVERTTGADRLLSTFSKHFAADYGIKLRSVVPHLDLGHDPEKTDRILQTILRAANVPVDAIKTEDQRVGVLRKILDDIERPDDTSSADVPPPLPGAKDKPPKGGHPPDGKSPRGRRARRDPLDRPGLAPQHSSQSLRIAGPQRLIGLYQECRTIGVDDKPNASALLLRVFLELSCEAYLTHHAVRPPGEKPNWQARGIKLDTKVQRVLTLEDPRRDRPGFENAWNGLSADEGYSHSISQLHRAMHDVHNLLDPRTIKRSWDLWYPLLEGIHDSMIDA